MASLTMEFNSQEDKERVMKKFEAIGSLPSAVSQGAIIASSSNIPAKMTLSAYQEGGVPQKLVNILDKYKVLSCSTKDYFHCEKAA